MEASSSLFLESRLCLVLLRLSEIVEVKATSDCQMTSGLRAGSSLVTQMVLNLPAMQETWVWSLGWEDPLGKGMATHSSIVWRITWTVEPGRTQSVGSQRVGHNWTTITLHAYLTFWKDINKVITSADFGYTVPSSVRSTVYHSQDMEAT